MNDFEYLQREVGQALETVRPKAVEAPKPVSLGEAKIPVFSIEVFNGIRIVNDFDLVSAGHTLKPDYVYEFALHFSETSFGGWGAWWQKKQMNEALAHFQQASPNTPVNWWGAGGHEVHIQVWNRKEQSIDDVWSLLLENLGTVYSESKMIFQSFEVGEATEADFAKEEEEEKERWKYWPHVIVGGGIAFLALVFTAGYLRGRRK